jgi:hypothetical protein
MLFLYVNFDLKTKMLSTIINKNIKINIFFLKKNKLKGVARGGPSCFLARVAHEPSTTTGVAARPP